MKKNKIFKHGRSMQFNILVSCISLILMFAVATTIMTFTNFSRFVQDTTFVQTEEISKQIVYNYNNYIQTVIEGFNSAQTIIDNVDVKKEKSNVENQFFNYLSHRSDINNVSLYTLGGEIIVSTVDNVSEFSASDVLSQAWFTKAISEPSVHFFSTPYMVENEYYILVSKVVSYNKGNDKGLMMLELNSDNIIELSETSNLGTGGHIIILDNNYNVVFTSKTGSNNESIKLAKEKVLGSTVTSVDGYRMMANINLVTNSRWKIAIFINIDESGSIQRNFLVILSLFSLITISCIAFLIVIISKRIANPLNKLEKVMTDIVKSDYFNVEEQTIPTGTQKEVVSLTNSFNNMMKKIKELMDKVIEEQEAQRNSELKALQNQINPHFLYNTLDSIVWLVENNKNKEAEEMVVALAKLFRISISRGRNIITVKDELEHAKSYLLIQSIRYVDAFKYEFDIEPAVLDCTTLKLILQPLIENAIYHGLKNRIDEGFIKISAKIKNNKLEFTIEDNGYGMKQEKIEQIYESFKSPNLPSGVGVKNVYLRLAIYYGKDADLQIESELDEGTIIRISIPVCSIEKSE